MPPHRSAKTRSVAKPKPDSELPVVIRPPAYLPNEVLEMILDYFEDDKPTLASCALTSQRFYHLAAPRLYARLEWGNNSKFPLTLPAYDVNTPLHRRFQTKLDIVLSNTREFHVGDHCKPHCKWCPWTKAVVKRIPENLSISVLSYNAFSNGQYVNSEENHIITPSSRCDLLTQFAPVKLVTRASYSEPLPIRSINQQNLAKIVSWVSIDDEYPGCDREQQIVPFAKSKSNTKTAVYIIHDMSALDKQLSVAAGSPMARIKEHLSDVVYRREYAQEILVVNDLAQLTKTSSAHIKLKSGPLWRKNVRRSRRIGRRSEGEVWQGTKLSRLQRVHRSSFSIFENI